MATMLNTYHFGHKTKIYDQVIVDDIMRKLHQNNIDTVHVMVNTTKEDTGYDTKIQVCILEQNDDVSTFIESVIESIRRKYNED